MNFTEPLRARLGSHTVPHGWPLPVGPGRWSVLFGSGESALLLPAGAFGRQRRCLSYFAPDAWNALEWSALFLSNAVVPAPGLLPEFRLEEGAHNFLSGVGEAADAAASAVRIGAAGRGQKACVLPVTDRGDGLAFAKLAMAPAADRGIGIEAAWLRELESVPELEQQVPRVLAEGTAVTGRRYLVETLAPCKRAGPRFTPAHAAFLGALGRIAYEIMSFTASPCLTRMEQGMARLDARVSRQSRGLLSAALHDCRVLLSGWTGPFVTAHGEFAPWNIRLQGERIFVLDWEHAERGANPLADAFNYFLMTRAVRAGAIGARCVASALRRVEEIAQQLYPEWIWRPRVVAGLALAYLLEAVLERASTGRGSARAQPRVNGYLRAIEERAAWMAD